jgi:hypothetical protein
MVIPRDIGRWAIQWGGTPSGPAILGRTQNSSSFLCHFIFSFILATWLLKYE